MTTKGNRHETRRQTAPSGAASAQTWWWRCLPGYHREPVAENMPWRIFKQKVGLQAGLAGQGGTIQRIRRIQIQACIEEGRQLLDLLGLVGQLGGGFHVVVGHGGTRPEKDETGHQQ